MSERITPSDLRPGQTKVVTYVCKDFTVVVPDPSWNMVGDLTQLPGKLREKLTHYSKNGFRKGQAIIDENTHSLSLSTGSNVVKDLQNHGYSIDDKRVVILGEFDSKGNRL